MSNNPRQIIVDVAREFLGTRETSANRGPHFQQFWDATSYPEGTIDRQPWCSAFASYCVQEADRRSPALNLRQPPRFPAVAQWLPWANEYTSGCFVFTSARVRQRDAAEWPQAGDIVIFTISHIGIVAADYEGKGLVETVEGNTNAAGGREGDGVFEKLRALTFCAWFIRIPAVAAPT